MIDTFNTNHGCQKVFFPAVIYLIWLDYLKRHSYMRKAFPVGRCVDIWLNLHDNIYLPAKVCLSKNTKYFSLLVSSVIKISRTSLKNWTISTQIE